MAFPVVVLMGVAGSGKTTVGRALAERLGWRYAEADDFHPPVNVAKMASGRPLTDADRWPWLHRIAEWIDERAEAGESAVVTCSALKRSYRDLLTGGRRQVRMVMLDGAPELIAGRLAGRSGHYMKGNMLASQLATLQWPEPDEGVVVVDVAPPPPVIVDRIVAVLGPSAE